MADTQHTAQNPGDGFAIGIFDPNHPAWPVVGEWQVWIGPAGCDPVASDDGLLLGHGATRDAALAMARSRVRQLSADLFESGRLAHRAGAALSRGGAVMRGAWERVEVAGVLLGFVRPFRKAKPRGRGLVKRPAWFAKLPNGKPTEFSLSSRRQAVEWLRDAKAVTS